jgi:protein ImuB
MFASIHAGGNLPILLDCARQFSPLIEITSEDTVTFDIRGLGRVHGSPHQIANEIHRRVGLPANIAIAANPDAAIYTARGIPGITVVPPGKEAAVLGPLSLHLLGCPAAMGELFQLWGIRTFGQFAALPPLGVAARMDEEGLRWQRLAQGVFRRQLRLVADKASFVREMDLEDPIPQLEPLFFLLSRFLHELCQELLAHSLATTEVRLRLQLERASEHLVTLRLPVPMNDVNALLKLLQLDLSEHPPGAAITKLRLELQPAKPRAMQDDLFAPAYPSPEKVELTIARIRHLVGRENIGSPRVLDTHQPDAFVMDPFRPSSQPQALSETCAVRFAFRRFRPPQRAKVVVEQQPVHIASAVVRGEVGMAKGPWLTSGHWWRSDAWSREEWDVALRGGALYRIFRDLTTELWFVEGNYD